MSNPFSPTQIRFGGHGNDDKNGVWVRLWLGPEGSPSVISSVADLNSGSPDLWRSLGKVGVLVSHADRKQIIDKIPSFPGRYAFRVVNSLGWSLGYVTANTVFGAPGAIVERQFGDLNLKKYRSSGTLAEWQQQVLPLCTGNSRLMFAILCAFAGPLLEILRIGSFGFQLFGPSSIGKTIVLIVGGSAWGCRVGASAHQGFCEKWATTLEAVERLGRVHNDGFGVIDDTRLVGNDRDIGKLIAPFIMRLHEGVAKNRAVAIDAGGDWRLVYLGSSNPPLAQIFAAAGLEFDDAYRVRFPDIPGDAGCGLGVFEHIHGYANAAEFGKELHRRATTYFGSASECYLERLANDRCVRRDWLRSELQHQIARYRHRFPAATGADGRIGDHFATIFAAGMLARHYGINGWSAEEIAWAVRRCERAHLEWASRNQRQFDPIAAVRAYIWKNMAAFPTVPNQAVTDQDFLNTPGFIYTPQSEYVIAPPVFEHQFAPIGLREVLGALHGARLLVRTGDKFVSKVPIRSSTAKGRKFAYRIRASILSNESRS
jgi:putative DNA primase/helicase